MDGLDLAIFIHKTHTSWCCLCVLHKKPAVWTWQRCRCRWQWCDWLHRIPRSHPWQAWWFSNLYLDSTFPRNLPDWMTQFGSGCHWHVSSLKSLIPFFLIGNNTWRRTFVGRHSESLTETAMDTSRLKSWNRPGKNIGGVFTGSAVFFRVGQVFNQPNQVLQSSEVEDALGIKAIADLMVEVDSNLDQRKATQNTQKTRSGNGMHIAPYMNIPSQATVTVWLTSRNLWPWWEVGHQHGSSVSRCLCAWVLEHINYEVILIMSNYVIEPFNESSILHLKNGACPKAPDRKRNLRTLNPPRSAMAIMVWSSWFIWSEETCEPAIRRSLLRRFPCENSVKTVATEAIAGRIFLSKQVCKLSPRKCEFQVSRSMSDTSWRQVPVTTCTLACAFRQPTFGSLISSPESQSRRKHSQLAWPW